ncbi:hypothetical protein QZM22_07285 [Burkholderia oklahomensis]|uniref:hypothetical protein n=1 Tax=Burkholderia oklahomensis TaxID=342113 RepID=UPI0026530206|nr:hypothetical protein [Burkholderia oklahomensis]MDN7672326.1 hypothetical protein [Burkholderia oklahomensis]
MPREMPMAERGKSMLENGLHRDVRLGNGGAKIGRSGGSRRAARVDSRRIGRFRHAVEWRLRRPFALSHVSIRQADSAPQFGSGLPAGAGRRRNSSKNVKTPC